MFKGLNRLMDATTGGESGATGGETVITTPVVEDATTEGQSHTENLVSPVANSTLTKSEEVSGDKAYWPIDWQEKFSKGDEKLNKLFQRYASPEAVAEALVAAQQRIRSGELKTVLPKDPKPEELAAWRKDNGIPETPEKYDLKFDNGLIIGKDDKPIIDGFLKTAHDVNLTPDQAKGAVEWYYKEQERLSEERLQKDDHERISALDALNAEWGGDFRRNINLVEGLLSKFPNSVRDSLKGGRLANGTGIFNNPDVLRSFAALALEVNPVATLVPSGNSDPSKSIDEEISKIEKTMRENRTAYNKDEKMQENYRQLLDAREKLKQRSA